MMPKSLKRCIVETSIAMQWFVKTHLYSNEFANNNWSISVLHRESQQENCTTPIVLGHKKMVMSPEVLGTKNDCAGEN
jgi:hypothetical protein